MVQYRVQCCTYNGHLSKGSPETAVAEWLGPTLEQSRTDKDSITPPDFVAVGFQVGRPAVCGLRCDQGISWLTACTRPPGPAWFDPQEMIPLVSTHLHHSGQSPHCPQADTRFTLRSTSPSAASPAQRSTSTTGSSKRRSSRTPGTARPTPSSPSTPSPASPSSSSPATAPPPASCPTSASRPPALASRA